MTRSISREVWLLRPRCAPLAIAGAGQAQAGASDYLDSGGPNQPSISVSKVRASCLRPVSRLGSLGGDMPWLGR